MTKGEAIRIVSQWVAANDHTAQLHNDVHIDGGTVNAIKRLLQEVKGNGSRNS